MTDNSIDQVVRITVKPLDRSAPGGFRLHQRVRNFVLRANAAQQSKDAVQSLETDAEIEAWVLSRLSVAADTTLDAELDKLSYDQYLDLFRAAIGGQSIDPLTATSSTLPAPAETLSLSGS